MHSSAGSSDAPWLRRTSDEPTQTTRADQLPGAQPATLSDSEADCDVEDTFYEFVSRVGMPTLIGSVFLLILLAAAATAAIAARLAASA